MDYFAKFKKRIVPPKVQPTSAMQLAKFHNCWDYVHNFFAEEHKANVHVEQTGISEKLRQMVNMLVDEEARQEDNTTGVCMEYFLKNGVLQYLVGVSEKADYPVGIRGEAIRTIASMIDLLDDRFLVHNAVHKPTIKLLRFCVLDERQSERYHEDLVDLMYIICSKIHGFPALLNIFFHDKQWLTTPQKAHHQDEGGRGENGRECSSDGRADGEPPASRKPEYEFLLFTYLLRFVHREGRSGDFARTGLLFLMEMATNQLGDFILESDFATIMAAGLGALYSQLPRKLVVKDDDELNTSSAAYLLGQDLDPRVFPSLLGVTSSSSPEFKYQLDSFLKLLEFCQDVLIRCLNAAISASLLHNIRTIFLENILYPSILECSDMDGSSVAVISYIDLILQTIQLDDLAQVIVGFLMDENLSDDMSPTSENMSSVPVDRDHATRYNGIGLDHLQRSPYITVAERFTLKDLIFSRLKSTSQPTVIATLKLLKTLIKKHCRYSLKLLSITPDVRRSQKGPLTKLDTRDWSTDMDRPCTIISHHIREVELYFSLIAAIDQKHADDILSTGYEEYLRDVENSIDSDACYQRMSSVDLPPQHLQSSKGERRRSFKYGQRFDDKQDSNEKLVCRSSAKIDRHCILPADPLLQILLGLLSHFFAQSSELNLALTGVISALAVCPYRSLEGWLSFRESDRTSPDDVLLLGSRPTAAPQETEDSIRGQDIYAYMDTTVVDEDDEDDDRSVDFGVETQSARMTAPIQFKTFPPFFTLLRTLTQQIDYYRSEVDGFDALLEERWKGLLFGEIEPPSTSNGVFAQPIPSPTTPRRMSLLPMSNSDTASIFGGGSPRRRSSVLRSPTFAFTANGGLKSPKSPNPSKSLSSTTMGAATAGSTKVPLSPPPRTTSMSGMTLANTITSNPTSPLAVHAQKTQRMRLQPLFPSNFVVEQDEPILDLDANDEETFAPKTNPSSRRLHKSTEIPLSMLLNNVVILEESIKELVAIMQVRRSLGIDQVRYA